MVTAMRIGFSEVSITPELGLPMAGMLRPPRAQGVQWPLFGRIMVLDDGELLAAIVSLDLLLLMASTVAELRQAITAGTGIAPGDVMIACTHTHRGPYTAALMDEEPNYDYLDLLRERLIGGMAQALAARQPARLRVGRIDAPGWTFNRRPLYRGEQAATHGPLWVPEFLRNEGPEDNELQVLMAEGSDGRALGGLVNYSCHTTVMGQEPVYSADYAGALTEELASRHGGIFAFLQGAAGNLSAYDLSREGPIREVGPEHNRRMGRALAGKATEALAGGRYLPGERLRLARRILHIPQRRPTPKEVELARWYLEKAPADLDQGEFTRRMYGHEYTFYDNSAAVQEWFAREAIGMWEWQRRAGRRELVEDVEIQVLAVDDVALAGYPAEYFTEFGLRTKGESPFAQTFVVELANGWHGYVPTREAFAHGGYEARLGYQGRLVPEAGDRMCEAALALLAQLAGTERGAT